MVQAETVSNAIATLVTTKFGVPQIYYGLIMEFTKAVYGNITNIDFSNSTQIISKKYLSDIDLMFIFNIIIFSVVVIYIAYSIYQIYCSMVKHISYIINSNFLFNYYKNTLVNRFYYPTEEIHDLKKIGVFTNYFYDNDYFVQKNISKNNILQNMLHPKLKSKYDSIIQLKIPFVNSPIYFYDKKFNKKGCFIWRTKMVKEEIEKEQLHSGQNSNSASSGSNNASPNQSNIVLKQYENVDLTIPYLEIIMDNTNIKEYYDEVIKETTYSPNAIKHTRWYNNDNFYIPIITVQNKDYHNTYLVNKKDYIDTFFHKDKKSIWSNLSKIHFSPEYFVKFGQYPQASYLLYGPPGTGKSSFAYRVAMALQRNIVEIKLTQIQSKRELRTILYDFYQQFNDVELKSKESVIVLDEFDLSVDYLCAKEKEKENKINDFKKMFDCIINSEDDEKEKTKAPEKVEALSEDDDDDITLSDLLNIFQGPVCNKGSIIFATTNKYKHIVEKAPRLFRDGRLKPVYFGYINNITLTQIVEFYFGSNFISTELDKFDIEKYQIPPVVILRMVFESFEQTEDIKNNDFIKLVKNKEGYKSNPKEAYSIFKKLLENHITSKTKKVKCGDYDREEFDTKL